MEASGRRDATINGGGTISAGTYEDVTINGAGTVAGDIVCTTLRLNGAGTVEGDVKAASVVVAGSASFAGSVQTTEMSVSGDAGVRGGLGVGRLTVRGNLRVDGGVAANEIDLKGVLRGGSSVTTGTLTGEGAVETALLKAETVDLAVYGTSQVECLEATKVTLRAPGSLADIVAIFKANEFKADRIRATEAWLENTVASMVSVGNVTVGAGSRIGLVHHSGTYARQGNAQVTEERKA